MKSNKIRRTYFISLPIGILLVIAAMSLIQCKTTYTATGTKWNLAAIYNPISSTLHPAFKVYHNSDQTSLLLVKLFPSELLFNQANVEGDYISKVSMQVQTYEIKEDKPILVDSVTFNYSINKKTADKRFMTQIPLKTELGKRYQLRIVTRDMLRKELNLTYVDVDKTSEFSDQNFNIVNQYGIPYFTNYLPAGSIFRIEHRTDTFKKLYIDYYKNITSIPNPNYAMTSDAVIYSKPDSSYSINYSDQLFLLFDYKGLYHYRFDTCQEEGLTILNMGKDFPRITSAEDMIEPLGYITTTPNYEKLLENVQDKLTVDNFWLKIGKNPNKARELIRIYYNRTYFANYYFTSIEPGWKNRSRHDLYNVWPPQ